MYKIQLLNKIAQCGLDNFGNQYEYAEQMENPDAILVRSAVMHDMQFGANLKAIARAGAGVNNIPVERCSEEGIVVFNTPGANANGVKELTIAALLLAARNIVGGIDWAKSLKDTEDVAKAVEKGKGSFAGSEIAGKTLGVIGLGAIGGMVANAASHLDMTVIGFDPYITIEAAWGLSRSVKKAANYEEIFKNADYITLHVPATKETKNMICKKTIDMMKDGVRIINLSRADLVCAADLKEALASGKVASYVTDFPTEETVGVEGIVSIPHLGASTLESEDNCAVMAVNELTEYLENGNIVNSVNFPNVSLARSTEHRICILHRNIPAMLSQISSVMAKDNINIENMMNRSKGEYAYTIVDLDGEVADKIISDIQAVDGIIRTFVI